MNKIIGWLGVVFGLFVAPLQLLKIIQTGVVTGISLPTYCCLCLAMCCYLYEAIRIKSPVFITAQSINLLSNTVILIILINNSL